MNIFSFLAVLDLVSSFQWLEIEDACVHAEYKAGANIYRRALQPSPTQPPWINGVGVIGTEG